MATGDAWDELESHAKELLGVTSPTWSIFKAEVVRVAYFGDLLKLTGGEHRAMKSGPRKGQRTCRPYRDVREVTIPKTKHDEWCAKRKERET